VALVTGALCVLVSEFCAPGGDSARLFSSFVRKLPPSNLCEL